jgi:hypothetical protein
MSSFKDNYSLFSVQDEEPGCNFIFRWLTIKQVPAAWFVAFVPHVVSTLVYTANKTSPRAYQSILEKDQTIDQAVSPSPHFPSNP